ncbi:cation:proton antiporter [Nitrospira sp. NS4]|uniref:cation:proton antiporter domain-containing protein n=1 Tax=Nitrospira sp. NS4 TaxID=3414498 RepID=UPI003C2F39B7
MTVLLTISAVMITVARRLGMGPQLGLLLSGVILGSSQVLSPPQVERMREVSELGVVFFLFVIGLELDLWRAWSLRRYAMDGAESMPNRSERSGYFRASAPPTISMSSLVMTPCLVLL